jgi:hypothetical protein
LGCRCAGTDRFGDWRTAVEARGFGIEAPTSG